MVFRKRPTDFVSCPSPSPSVCYLKREQKIVDGVEIVNEAVITSSIKDYNDTHPVPFDELTVGQQIEAGISMKEIPVNGMLDSRDNLDYDEDALQQKVLDSLNAQDSE